MKKLIILLLFLPCVMLGQDTTKGGLPLIKGRKYEPRLASDTVFIGTMNAKTQISANADSAASAHNRITQQGNVSVLEFGAVANGVANDSLPFANAIASVVSGGTLVVPAGTYSTGQININKALTLELKNGAIIKARDNLNTSLILVEADNVTITGGTIDGNRANQDPDTTDHTSYDTENFTHGIKVLYDTSAGGVGRKNFKLLNTTIKNTWDNGLYLRGKWEYTNSDTAINDVLIQGCTFDSIGGNCVFIREIKNLQIIGNEFLNWDMRDVSPISTVDGIAFFSSNYVNVNISNNIFKPTSICTSFGIEVTVRPIQHGFLFADNILDGVATGISGWFFDATFTGNIFTNGGNNHRSGLELIGSDIVVTGNKISNGAIAIAGERNILVTGNTITVSDTTTYGVAVGIGDTPDSNIVVRGNTIDVSNTVGGYGMIVGTYGAAGILQTFEASDNLIIGNSTTTGIRLVAKTGTTDVTFEHNRILGCDVALLCDSTGLDGAIVTVERNDFRDNTTPVSKGDVYGVYTFKDNYPTYVNDAATAFVPTSVDSLKAWYTGGSANRYTSPDTLNSWSDLSGQDYILQGGGLFASDQVNGLPSILNPTQVHYAPPAHQSTTEFTAFVVAKNLSEGGHILGNQYLADSVSSLMFIGGKLAYVSTVAGVGDTVLASATTISSSIYGMYEWSRSGNTISMHENGVSVGSGTTNARPFIFSRMDGLDSTYIAEVLVYTNVLTDSQRFLIENYLNDKYSLTTNYLGNLVTTGTIRTDSIWADSYGNLPSSIDSSRASHYADSLRSAATGTGRVVRETSPIFTGSSWIDGRFGIGVDPIAAATSGKLVLYDSTTGAILLSFISNGTGTSWFYNINSSSVLNISRGTGGDILGLSGTYPNFIVKLAPDGGRVLVNGAADDGHSEVNITGQIRTTILSAAVTDGAPTASEINTATGLASAAAAGAGFETWLKDTDGTALMYRVVSDGTSWWTYSGTVAP